MEFSLPPNFLSHFTTSIIPERPQLPDDIFFGESKLDVVINTMKKIEENQQQLIANSNAEEVELNAKMDEENKSEDIEILLDNADNSDAEKIVFLYELGVLDYLQNKMKYESNGFSANKIAELVSTFSGIKARTAQSYINPIFSKDANQVKSPLTSKNIEKVKNKLIKLGVNITKSIT